MGYHLSGVGFAFYEERRGEGLFLNVYSKIPVDL
jgi:hypothetical protein